MVESVVIDSNFFISRLRQREDPFLELAESAGGKFEFYTCGMVILEVCRGVKLEKAMKAYRAAFSVMTCVPATSRVWEIAADLAWRMDRTGLTMQAPDLIIAASALSINAAVLTEDGDFLRVPGLTVWSSLPEA